MKASGSDNATGHGCVNENWSFRASGALRTAFAIDGTSVYCGGADGIVYAVDVFSGNERWRFDSGSSIGGSPAIGGSLLFFGTRAGTLFALDIATGMERWRHKAGTAFQVSPLVAVDRVLAGGKNGILLALETATGEVAWRVDTKSPFVSDPVTAGGLVFIRVKRLGQVFGFRLSDGRAVSFPGVVNGTRAYSGPVVAGAAIITGCGDGVRAYNPATGKELWRYRTIRSVQRPPCYSDGKLFFQSGGALIALDATSGEELWKIDRLGVALQGPLTMTPRGLMATSRGRVLFIDPLDGEVIRELNTGIGRLTRPALSDNDVIVGDSQGVLTSFSAHNGCIRTDRHYSNAQQSWHLYPLMLLSGWAFFPYWCYRNWKSLKLMTGAGLRPGLRLMMLFSPALFYLGVSIALLAAAPALGDKPSAFIEDFSVEYGLGVELGSAALSLVVIYLIYDQFRRIRAVAQQERVASFSLPLVTVAFTILTLAAAALPLTWRLLPDWSGTLEGATYSAVTNFGVSSVLTVAVTTVMATVQRTSNRIWMKRNNVAAVRNKFTGGEIFLMVLSGLFVIMLLWWAATEIMRYW